MNFSVSRSIIYELFGFPYAIRTPSVRYPYAIRTPSVQYFWFRFFGSWKRIFWFRCFFGSVFFGSDVFWFQCFLGSDVCFGSDVLVSMFLLSPYEMHVPTIYISKNIYTVYSYKNYTYSYIFKLYVYIFFQYIKILQ